MRVLTGLTILSLALAAGGLAAGIPGTGFFTGPDGSRIVFLDEARGVIVEGDKDTLFRYDRLGNNLRVTFMDNGAKAAWILAPDGQRLEQANGPAWHREEAAEATTERAIRACIACMMVYVRETEADIAGFKAARTPDEVRLAERANLAHLSELGTRMGGLNKRFSETGADRLKNDPRVATACRILIRTSQDIAAAQQAAIERSKGR